MGSLPMDGAAAKVARAASPWVCKAQNSAFKIHMGWQPMPPPEPAGGLPISANFAYDLLKEW